MESCATLASIRTTQGSLDGSVSLHPQTTPSAQQPFNAPATAPLKSRNTVRQLSLQSKIYIPPLKSLLDHDIVFSYTIPHQTFASLCLTSPVSRPYIFV